MISKYYSLDECQDHDLIYGYLEKFKNDDKLSFEDVDLDVIKIKNISLTTKDEKDIIKFFNENNVIDYDNFESIYGDEDEEEDEDYDNDYTEDDGY